MQAFDLFIMNLLQTVEFFFMATSEFHDLSFLFIYHIELSITILFEFLNLDS